MSAPAELLDAPRRLPSRHPETASRAPEADAVTPGQGEDVPAADRPLTGRSEALIIACALAMKPTTVGPIGRSEADHVLTATLPLGHEHVLRWRQVTEPNTWSLRWRWAAAATRQLFPMREAVNNLPAELEDVTEAGLLPDA